MSWKKNERPQSHMEFTAAAEQIIRKVYEDRFTIPDATGEKHFIISDTPFTRRGGRKI